MRTTDTMSVDAYIYWDGMTQEDRDLQSILNHPIRSPWDEGAAGYIHDFNGHTPTAFLISEAYDDDSDPIPAVTLAQRLPKTLRMVREQYGDTGTYKEQMLTAFVFRMIQLETQGRKPRIRVSW